ncbi:MAG: type I glyceraldehyde-3-phosphate dehydrogenase [bacterium]
MGTAIGVNGFGRIGRLTVRSALERGINVAGINDVADPDRMAHLFKYDSVHGTYPESVDFSDGTLTIGDQEIEITQKEDPSNLPWNRLGVEVAVESTGLFRDRESSSKHLEAGAEKVVISAPATNPDLTVVLGVNDDEYAPAQHDIISNASCTTNCLSPVAMVLNDEFGIESGTMTTTHAYTGSQNLLDGPQGKDYRRMRTAAESMVPTSTGAAVATTKVLPELEGKIDGMAVRVPVPDVSLVDFSVVLEQSLSKSDLDSVMKEYAEGELEGILDYTEEPLVSVDYMGNPHSSIYDADQSMIVSDNHAKVISWYDNEWGYANRIVDLSQSLL